VPTASVATWNWRPDVLLVIGLLGTAYVTGWVRLRRRVPRVARPWRLGLYLVGLATIGLALVSPVHALAAVLFLMHMVQHELLIMVAPPLLLLADPMAVILWGLPRRGRRLVGRLLARGGAVRRMLWALTWMPVAWGVYVVHLWAWHLPVAYQAVLRYGPLHDLQHLGFFATAVLFWWPIAAPAPRLHGFIPYGWRILYVLAATAQNTILGAAIALPGRLLYPYYASTPRLWGVSPLEDQAYGGGIMWEGGAMFLIALLVLVARYLEREERLTRQREAASEGSGQVSGPGLVPEGRRSTPAPAGPPAQGTAGQ
jgi:cytochrome c oxidase assembly factor CtaG